MCVFSNAHGHQYAGYFSSTLEGYNSPLKNNSSGFFAFRRQFIGLVLTHNLKSHEKNFYPNAVSDAWL